MSEIRFKLKDMVGFNWDMLSDDQKENIVNHILKNPLEGDVPHRFGFVKGEAINENQIYGYFTQEFEEEKHRYNNQKKEEKYIDNPFEDFFFIILFDVGICLLQSRKIRNIPMSTIEEKFTEALKNILNEMGIKLSSLEDLSWEIGKDVFISTFDAENVISLKVNSLKGRIIPEYFKIFNPHVEKDSIVRALCNDDFRRLDEASLATDDRGGLQELKLSKIMLHTGKPREMKYIGRDGAKITMTDKIGPSISLNIDLESPTMKDIRSEVNKFCSSFGDKKDGNDIGKYISKQRSLFSFKEKDDY